MSPERTGPHPYGIGAVDRALDVADAMARLGPATLARLAEASGCTRVTAFRILHTLQARGLATQDGKRGTWRLGVGWLALGRRAAEQGALSLAASPTMAALARSCDEPVMLTIRDGEQAEVVAVHRGRPTARPFAAVGDRYPLHAGPGRLLLAFAPPTIQRAVLTGRLSRIALATRINPVAIEADLPRLKVRNWLITTDEISDSIVTVSTAIQDDAGNAVAMLSIASTALRMRPPRPHTLLTPLLAASLQLEEAFAAKR
jgi:DNA-binding IclR family transcriptional regulator